MMATKTSQRVFIWAMVILMTVGTVGTFGALILSNENASNVANQQQEMLDQYYQQVRDQAKLNQGFADYQAETFNGDEVDQLVKTDLKKGDGEEVKLGDTIKVSYFGWTEDGTIFDSTKKQGADNEPIEFPLAEGSLIKGWTKGIPGMKVGGVRKLTVPADQAYGSAGSPPLIGSNEPLTFIVRIEAIS